MSHRENQERQWSLTNIVTERQKTMSPAPVTSLLSLLLLVSVSGDSEAETKAGGSGEQYLRRTEDRWDGKTAWFTGSSEFITSE